MSFPGGSDSKESAYSAGFPHSSQLVKNPPVMQETPLRFPGQEDPLEKGKATHSSIPAWRIQNSMDHIVYGVIKRQTRLDRLSLSFPF